MPKARSAAPPFGAPLQVEAETSRLLDVARAEFIAHGIRRASVSEIARRAGVSRPTLFRRCGDKDDILVAVAVRDLVGFFARAAAVLQPLSSLEDRVVEVFVLGMRETREHPMIKALLDFEDPKLTSVLADSNSGAYRMMLTAISGLLNENRLHPQEAMERALEVSLRLTASLIASPSGMLPTNSDYELREFAQRYLIAILRAALQP